MKIGIVGLPSSGKTTIFHCLTGVGAELDAQRPHGKGQDANLRQVPVPDRRLDVLTKMYEPRKTTHAQVQYVDVAGELKARDGESKGLDELLRHLRPVDALLHVVRAFEWAGTPPTPREDYERLEEEIVFADLMIVERRLERMEQEHKKGRKYDPEEHDLLKRAQALLEAGRPLRVDPELREAQKLRGYAFLSAKPEIVCLNLGEGMEEGEIDLELEQGTPLVGIKGAVEQEILELSPEEQEAFREEMGIEEPAMHVLIRESYRLLGLISFFTVGKDEVRAWTIKEGTTALKAAGVIHSDIERGFIRAEVVAYDDLVSLGSYGACQKAGKVRLEGKDYVVKDGDIIHFRFNV